VKPCQTLYLLRKTPVGRFCAVPQFPRKIPKTPSGMTGGGNAAAENNLFDHYEKS
jgi:hypothetical protein